MSRRRSKNGLRYRLSLDWYEQAKTVTPGGAQTLSKMPIRFPLGSFPIAVERGDGARIQDIDGNWYVDWINALGAVTLGYQHPHVVDSIIRQLKDGVLFSLPHRIESEVSARLTRWIPCADSVRWFKTGSEATQAAIRTARICTGRDIVLTVGDGYHGWHSWFLAVKPWHPGVPKAYEDLIKPFRYNDLSSLEVQLERYGARTAAVILEPCHFEMPMPGFLEGVRELCNRYQTVLVFDEIITGFRWARAGGQEYFGVVPDLATFGKAAANGLPIAFLCGKKHFMRHAELVQGGTFGGDALSLAACNAVLDVYEKEPIIDTLWTRGAALQKSFNQAAKDVNVEAVCSGFPCKPRIDFFPYTESKAHDDGRRKRFAMSLFLQEAAAAGVLFHPVNCNVSAVLSEEDMKATSRAIKTALRAVARALKDDDWSALMGQPIQPVGPLRT
jgi:glutamate-1-semialdehyde 2,1-aminomutase